MCHQLDLKQLRMALLVPVFPAQVPLDQALLRSRSQSQSQHPIRLFRLHSCSQSPFPLQVLAVHLNLVRSPFLDLSLVAHLHSSQSPSLLLGVLVRCSLPLSQLPDTAPVHHLHSQSLWLSLALAPQVLLNLPPSLSQAPAQVVLHHSH